jgi:hypothetical protein
MAQTSVFAKTRKKNDRKATTSRLLKCVPENGIKLRTFSWSYFGCQFRTIHNKYLPMDFAISQVWDRSLRKLIKIAKYEGQ